VGALEGVAISPASAARVSGTGGARQTAPYALAVSSVLSLVAASDGELVRASDLVLPVTIMLAVAALAHILGWLSSRDAIKSALIGWVIVTGFGSFGDVLAAFKAGATVGPSPRETAALISCVAVVGVFVVAVARSRRQLGGVLGYAALVSGLVLGWDGWFAGRTLLASERPAGELLRSAIPAPDLVGRPPDILLLVLDKYTASHILGEQYGFDNGEFIRFLRARGFLVPPAARANYVHTYLALNAMLNMEYLDSSVARVGTTSLSRAASYAAIERNRLAAFLREHGYRFVFSPTAYGATRRNRYADVQIPDPHAIRPEFVTAWYKSTPLPTMHRLACAALGCVMPMPYVPETAAMLDWKFEQLANLAGQERPVFALVHLTVPHEPYIYGSDCRHREPYWPTRDDGRDSARVSEAYIEQIQCLNQKLETLIAAWQANGRVPPVILLQADHGHGRAGRHLPDLEEVSAAQIADRTSVFAAYCIPGADPRALPDTVTPVNTMRFTLRTVFSADLPPLEDRTYWSPYDVPHRLSQVR